MAFEYIPPDTELAREGKAAGVCFYELPEDVLAAGGAGIDPLIWPIVARINESGWCFTAESCQGHPDANGPAWDELDDPMLRLACERHRLGDMMRCLVEAATGVPDQRDPEIRHDHALRIWPRWMSKGTWSEVLVYVPGGTVFLRDRAFYVLRRFAEIVCNWEATVRGDAERRGAP